MILYTSHNIAAKIKMIAKAKGIKTGIMLKDCGVNKDSLSTMQSKGCLPRTETLAKIADYLDVSVDYLLDRTDNSDSHKKSIITG
jgi:transcriptional regulator with XRE-family HTH domain